MCCWIGKHPLWTLALACLVAVSGCGGAERGHEAYIPSEDRAKDALEKALAAWKNGQPHGTIEAGTAKINVVDSKWQSGQKLASYEILRAEPGQGPVAFSVKLLLTDPPGEQQVRYVVLGPTEGLWVYREEDFKQISGMEGAPPAGSP